jgi:23S rRNA (cytidine1920-2'-O)/16S rRNA (cytidine1409-2'-O)-methyltransferase
VSCNFRASIQFSPSLSDPAGCAWAAGGKVDNLVVAMNQFVSRAGQKLDHAITSFGVSMAGTVCADLGCSTGGFTDCLLQRGAARVYALDTGYGVLDWKLRQDARVVVMERTNAMHAQLPEMVDWVTIDVAWTRQQHILPAARRLLRAGGRVISLVKPHYEASAKLLRRGVLPAEHLEEVQRTVAAAVRDAGFAVLQTTPSPIKGAKGNVEWLWLLSPT